MIDFVKKTKIRRLTLPLDKRIIFMSDIHGDIDSFKEALDKINFSKDDYLFIIGDIYEKGDEDKNLATLLYVRDLAISNPNVYPMAGNCDEVFRFILPDEAKDTFLLYALEKKHSVINDIAKIEGIELSKDMDVKAFINMLQTKYSYLYDFMDSLDDVIIINDQIVLVHGGIDDINNIPSEAISMLKYDRFYELSPNQDKLMIVGHYPTRNYRPDVSAVNPIFDFQKKIISIDGGNHIVKGGQLNVVYLESLETMRFRYFYTDHYEKMTVKKYAIYDLPTESFNITFGENEVEILDADLDFYFIRHLKSKTTMWVHKTFVYNRNNHYYCYDASNQFITVHKGEEISLIKKALPYSLIKKNGYIGLIETKYLEDDF